MSDSHTASLRAGVAALIDLMRRLHAKTETDLAAYYRANPDGLEGRDWRGMSAMVQSTVVESLHHPDAEHREGFVLALTDMLSAQVDGGGVDYLDWDPLKHCRRSDANQAIEAVKGDGPAGLRTAHPSSPELTLKQARLLLYQIADDAHTLANFVETARDDAGNARAESNLHAVQMMVERIGMLADFNGSIVGDPQTWMVGPAYRSDCEPTGCDLEGTRHA